MPIWQSVQKITNMYRTVANIQFEQVEILATIKVKEQLPKRWAHGQQSLLQNKIRQELEIHRKNFLNFFR